MATPKPSPNSIGTQPALVSAEQQRMAEDRAGTQNWRRWGPYLAERQWGTVREDYSPGGTAWEYLPHDHARSRAYRWGEDGIAGFSDDWQHLCLSLGMWNGRDPILKERLFGLTNSEGNHGEDVKELYYYLDGTPSHSYLKMLYKYPQGAFPYTQLVEENRRRGPAQPEFELLDTGLFDEDHYFDVFVEYAKAAPEDILMLVTVHNRGPQTARLVLLPQICCRNTWTWYRKPTKPCLSASSGGIRIEHPKKGNFQLHCEGTPDLLFCENETNERRLFGKTEAKGYFKDAFHEYLIQNRREAVNPQQTGTKAGASHDFAIPAGGQIRIRLRLTTAEAFAKVSPWTDFDDVIDQCRREADEFYAGIQQAVPDADARLVQRQAFAGLIWSKQFFHYNVSRWLAGDTTQPPPPPERLQGRNSGWKHLNNAEVISMPDKWEYPWYAAWDLSFHCVALAEIDPEFAKSQLILLLREWYMHPNGQLPAYEWAFGDVNPPVQAWAAFRVFQIDRRQRQETDPGYAGDWDFLERNFQKLLINFTWWVNRKDEQGRNIFQGGFLGLDNIGVFDRSKPLPTGGFINQADGTSWMAMYCLNMLRISLELSAWHDRVYEDIATKFFEHFLAIAAAINGVAEDTLKLWDEADQFYYDHIILPDNTSLPVKIQSAVGLLPLLVVEVLEPELLKQLPAFSARMEWHLQYRPELAGLISNWQVCGIGDRKLLSLLRGHRMNALLRRMLDETQFLSDQGVRSLSKRHEQQPFVFVASGARYEVGYWPAESKSGMFGGNSNWRGPIWMPINYLIIEALQKFHHYYGDDFKVECPAGSGKWITIEAVADELVHRLAKLFLVGQDGQRPVLKTHPKQSTDPQFKDYVLFHEYFHGDTGMGLGASHQTGWTGLIAKLLRPPRQGSSRQQNVAGANNSAS